MKHLLLTTIAAVLLVGCVSETNYSGTYVSESPLVHDVNVTLSENGEFTLISEENTETVMGDWTIKGKIIELNPKKNIRIYEEMKAQLNDDNTFSIGFGESQITGNWVKKEKMVHLNIKNGGESIKFKFEKNELIMLDQIADLKLIKEGSKKIKDDYSKLDFTETLTINSAIILGDLAKVKLAVESGLDPNTPVGGTSNEMPMLNWASMGKNTELIKYLIDKGADVNSKNKDGLTPLMFAGNKGRGTNALLLIESGANLFAKTSKQATCAHYLSYCLMPELINLLIDRGVDFNQKDNRGRIPLMWASSNLRNRNERLVKNDEIKKAIEILISQTKDINEKDHQGLTALHQANDVLFAELLIKQGANINIKDNDGLTPLDTASLEKPYFGKNTRLVELLKSKAAKSGADDSLKVAIKVWNEKALIKHIDNGANPNQKLDDDYSLLDKYLLNKKRKNSEDQFGMMGMATSKLDRSKKRNEDNEDLLEKIISKGGTNTLVGAIGIRDANLIEELVANKKINPNIRKKNGAPAVFDLFSDISNPLSGLMDMNSMMGWKKEDFESLNMLLDNNLDVNLAIIDPMMMQPKTILDCLEQELELAGGMPGMPGMPDSSSLKKQFKELISKIKSKGGTNAAPSNLWSEEFNPSKIRSQTGEELKAEVK